MDLTVVEGNCEKLFMNDDSVDLVVTSPPYYVAKNYSKEVGCIGGEKSYYHYLEKMELVFKELFRTLKVGRYCVINISDILVDGTKYPIPFHYLLLLQRVGFTYMEDIIWRKPKIRCGGCSQRFGVFMQNPYPRYYYPNSQYEHCLIFLKGGKPSYAFKRSEYEVDPKSIIGSDDLTCFDNDVWYINPVNASTLKHAAPYPNELVRRFIMVYSVPGEVVLDPFLGSGTTMNVAKSMGRSCVGYEINGEYVNVIKERVGWNQTTLNTTEPIKYKHLRECKEPTPLKDGVTFSKLREDVFKASVDVTQEYSDQITETDSSLLENSDLSKSETILPPKKEKEIVDIDQEKSVSESSKLAPTDTGMEKRIKNQVEKLSKLYADNMVRTKSEMEEEENE